MGNQIREQELEYSCMVTAIVSTAERPDKLNVNIYKCSVDLDTGYLVDLPRAYIISVLYVRCSNFLAVLAP